MKLIFLEFDSVSGIPVHVNLKNILYSIQIDPSTTRIVCVNGIELIVKESYENVTDSIEKAIEHAHDD